MRVRLTTGRFGRAEFDLALEEDRLLFFDGLDLKKSVPLSALRYFGMEGTGSRKKCFVLETDTDLFEGVFLHDADAQQFIRCLQASCGCHLNVSMDAFQGGREV